MTNHNDVEYQVCIKGTLDGMKEPVVAIFTDLSEANNMVAKMNEYYKGERFYVYIDHSKTTTEGTTI